MPSAGIVVYLLVVMAVALVAYSLGRMHERRRSGRQKPEITAEEMSLGALFELKRIQFEVKRSRSNEEFNDLLNRLRKLFDEHFELRESFPANAQFCRDWLNAVMDTRWDNSAKVRFREHVERLRAE